jgi:hypothetical protein
MTKSFSIAGQGAPPSTRWFIGWRSDAPSCSAKPIAAEGGCSMQAHDGWKCA